VLFRLMPPLDPWIGIPLCVAAFAAAAVALRLIGARDLSLLWAAFGRPRVAVARAGGGRD